MFVIVGCGVAVMGRPGDPIVPNQPPSAPVVMEDKSGMEKQEYRCFFYSVDPDGDKVYYHITWKKIGNEGVTVCGPDDPVVTWDGPFNSGEEVNEVRSCKTSGDYELTIRAKDEFDNEGPSTTITVSYTKAKILQNEFFSRILTKFPWFVYFLTKIFKI